MTSPPTPHFQIARSAFKPHGRVLVFSTLILFASWAVLELSVVALHGLGVGLNVLLHLAFLVFASGLMVGIHRIALQVVDGRVPHLKQLTASLRQGPNYLIASCLYLIAVMVGLALLVAPGVYVAVRYAFFGQVLATKNVSALEALRCARALSQGQWWRIGRVLLAALALNLGGAALLGVGFFISFPVSNLMIASFYRSLTARL